MRNIKACITALLPELWKKGHPRKFFSMGETAMDDMKDITELKENENLLKMNLLEYLQKRTKN